ncbi:MAG: hypothetical protein A2W10_00795 [Deltaproteobacteria bacterium RBG_16_55_12]|nr:MAG: hypothetical protein A2W10_00795 [Deltaproteobacteria bacterium RBG_16_55_12]
MNKQFSARLRAAIQAMGINPTHFAYKSGVPQGTISKCLHGHVPSAKLLLRISRTAGRSVDWFLTGKEPEVRRGEYVAETPTRYGYAGRRRTSKTDESVWIEKLLGVLRSGNRRKKQTIKELLDVLSR